MARLIKKQKKEIGLSPDALYFSGQKKIDTVILHVIDFDGNNFTRFLVLSFLYHSKTSSEKE